MSEKPPDLKYPLDHEERMAQARRRAAWELGDGSWAGVIIGAYFYPRADSEALDYEMGPPATTTTAKAVVSEKKP